MLVVRLNVLFLRLRAWEQMNTARIMEYAHHLWQHLGRWIRHRDSRSVWGIITVLICLVLLDGLVFGLSMSTLVTRETWVRHSLTVQKRIDDLTASLAMAETGQRGYLLTGNDSYLQPYTQALPRIQRDMHDLQFLTPDNLSQQHVLVTLRPLIAAKLAELQQTIALRHTRGICRGHCKSSIQIRAKA
jgi:methyl-accepting chemotaxis protein